jgi:hypothetical protein
MGLENTSRTIKARIKKSKARNSKLTQHVYNISLHLASLSYRNSANEETFNTLKVSIS